MRPIHPAIVHFPIALMTFSVVLDLVGYLTDSSIFQFAGFLALLGTGIGAAVAIITGLIDKSRVSVSSEPFREDIRFHMQVGFGLFVVIARLKPQDLKIGLQRKNDNLEIQTFRHFGNK